jgi:hypothetical protein
VHHLVTYPYITIMKKPFVLAKQKRKTGKIHARDG